ncbi:MAG TPA: MFS transporter [Spirochaetia bacterium]
MSDRTDSRLAPGATLAMILLGFSGQLAWAIENQFFNTFLYDRITPDPRPISWMVSITAVVALLTTILMGTLSDRQRGRHGRRKPFILAGYVLWAVFTAVYPLAGAFKTVAVGVTMAIVFDSIMSFWGSTANDSSFNAWVTDVTVPSNRGKYVGILEILKWVALLVTYGGAGLAVSAFGYPAFFVISGGIVLVMGVIGGVLVTEPPLPAPETRGYWRQIADTFQWESLRSNRDLLLVLLGVMFWNVAFNIFFPYLMIYLQHYARMEGIMASLTIAVGILVGGIGMAYPLGLLVDRWGRKPVSLVAVIAECVGLLLFSFARSPVALVLTGILWVMPMAAWSIATTAWDKDLFPADSRGQFQGYEILFRVTLTMIPGPLVGGWLASRYGIPTVIDGKPGFIPTPIIFQAGALGTLLAAVPILFARERSRS